MRIAGQGWESGKGLRPPDKVGINSGLSYRYNARMPSRPKDHRRTEQRNPTSKNLDRMTAREIVRLMNREDRKVAIAVGREIPAIARAVQAVIAGGRRAITHAVEGAEDSTRNGERDLRAKKLTRDDVVVGIAASGTTPYVLGARKYARSRGATTVAVTSNLRMPVGRLAKIVIAPEVGPEVLTGSTRLKAGTSQKMVLNMLSTAVMARLGHVYENLMIDMMLTNEKLAERALRILAEASGKSVSTAEHALRAAGHNMRVALVMLKPGVVATEARKKLKAVRGELRRALGE